MSAVAPLAAQRKRRARWAIAVVVVVVIAAIAAVVPVILNATKETTTAPATVSVETRTLTQVVSGSGSTVAAESVSVNPEVSGTVTKLYVSLGDTVQQGDKLYRISDSDAQETLLRAKSSLLQSRQSKLQAQQSLSQASNQLYAAKTQKIEAQQKLERLESQPATSPAAQDAVEIAERQLTSAKKGVTAASKGVDSAEAGVSAANANYAEAQNTYDEAAADLGNTVVTAPIDGTVTSLPLSKGDYVAASSSGSSSSSSGASSGGASGASSAGGSTASSTSSSGSSVVIADLTNLEVTVAVSEVDVSNLAVGMESTTTIDALSGETFPGTVKSIAPNGTNSSGVVNYSVEVALNEGDERLRPDMTATTDIVTNVAEAAVVVPNSAIKSDGATKYVLVSVNGGAGTRRTVKIGISDDTYTQVMTGVQQGERVLTASASSSATSNDRGFGGGMMGGPPGGGRPGGN